MSHTPGPWSAFDDEIVTERTETHVATVALEDGMNPTEWQANMRLIAAAPDLLAACQELLVAVSAAMRVVADLDAMKALGAEADTREQRFVQELHVSGVVDGFGVRAKAAIAKAEGR